MRATRRDVLKAGSAAAIGAALPASANAQAPSPAPNQMQAAIRQTFGEAPIRAGKVTLELPPLVESGNVVPIAVTVESPMTKDNYVKAIHVFNEKNPQPNVISVQLGPRAGKAHVATRIRLASSQKLIAIAEMSDGSCWSDTQDVVVTLAACLEDLI